MPFPNGARLLCLLTITMTLSACATDELALAPARPEQPWVIPTPDAALPRPGSTPILERSQIVAPKMVRDNAVSIDPTRRYSLVELIDLAQRHNPETREAWERARQAAFAVGLSETSFLPQITADVIGGFQRTPLPIPETLIPKGYFTSNTREIIPMLTAKWLLFDFGQRDGAIEAARANSFIANVAFTGAHQRLVFAVSRDYFALGAARGRLAVAKQALKTAEIVQDATEARRAHGLATVVQVAQTHRQTAQARFNLERAAGADRAAYSALVASIGIAPDSPIETVDSSEQSLPDISSGDVDQLVNQALANRPDVIAAIEKIKVAEATLHSAEATYYPTVALETSAYQNIGELNSDGSRYSTVNQPGASLLLKLSVPIFDGGARDARAAIARSEVAAARDAVDRARDTAVHQVTDAYDALRTSFAEYTAALVLNEATRTAFDSALDAYRHGVGTYTDVASEESALSQAQSEKEDAHANVLTAAAALAFSTGAALTGP